MEQQYTIFKYIASIIKVSLFLFGTVILLTFTQDAKILSSSYLVSTKIFGKEFSRRLKKAIYLILKNLKLSFQWVIETVYKSIKNILISSIDLIKEAVTIIITVPPYNIMFLLAVVLYALTYYAYPKIPNFTSFKKFISKSREDKLVDIEIEDQIEDIKQQSFIIENIVLNNDLQSDDKNIIQLYVSQLFEKIDDELLPKLKNFLNVYESHQMYQSILQKVQSKKINDFTKKEVYNPRSDQLQDIDTAQLINELQKNTQLLNSNAVVLNKNENENNKQNQNTNTLNNFNFNQENDQKSQNGLSEKEIIQKAKDMLQNFIENNDHNKPNKKLKEKMVQEKAQQNIKQNPQLYKECQNENYWQDFIENVETSEYDKDFNDLKQDFNNKTKQCKDKFEIDAKNSLVQNCYKDNKVRNTNFFCQKYFDKHDKSQTYKNRKLITYGEYFQTVYNLTKQNDPKRNDKYEFLQQKVKNQYGDGMKQVTDKCFETKTTKQKINLGITTVTKNVSKEYEKPLNKMSIKDRQFCQQINEGSYEGFEPEQQNISLTVNEETDPEYLVYFLNNSSNISQSNFAKFGIDNLEELNKELFNEFNKNKSIMYLANDIKKYLEFIQGFELTASEQKTIEKVIEQLVQKYNDNPQLKELQKYYTDELKPSYRTIPEIKTELEEIYRNPQKSTLSKIGLTKNDTETTTTPSKTISPKTSLNNGHIVRFMEAVLKTEHYLNKMELNFAQYQRLVYKGSFKRLNQQYLFECLKNIGTSLSFPYDYQWLIEQSMQRCYETLNEPNSINILQKLFYVSMQVDIEGEIKDEPLLSNYILFKKFQTILRRLRHKQTNAELKKQFIGNFYLNCVILSLPEGVSKQLIESIQDKYHLYNSLINKNILIRKRFVFELIQRDIFDVVDLQYKYVQWWKNNIKWFISNGLEVFSYKDIGGFKNVTGFPKKMSSWVQWKVNSLLLGNASQTVDIQFSWRDLGIIHMINPFLTEEERNFIKREAQQNTKNFPLLGIYKGSVYGETSTDFDAGKTLSEIDKQAQSIQQVTSKLQGGSGAFFASGQYICDFENENNGRFFRCRNINDGNEYNLFLESRLYKYFEKEPNKYLKHKIDNVNPQKMDYNYGSYFNHDNDRYKKCKDSENIVGNYFGRTGEIINMYCRDEQKPIYYNSIYDFDRNVLICGSISRKKEFKEWSQSDNPTKFTIVQNVIKSPEQADTYIKYYEEYARRSSDGDRTKTMLYIKWILTELYAAKMFLEAGISLPRPNRSIEVQNEFYICQSNNMDDCKSEWPFQDVAEAEERGFWSSMTHFAKGAISMFKLVPNIMKQGMSLIQFMFQMIQSVLKNPGSIIEKIIKMILLVIWNLASKVLGLVFTVWYIVFNVVFRFALSMIYILGGFGLYGVILLTALYIVCFNPISIQILRLIMFVKQFSKLLDLKNPEEEYTRKYSSMNKGSSVCYGDYVPRKSFCIRDPYNWEIPQYTKEALILQLAEKQNGLFTVQKIQPTTRKLFGKNPEKYIQKLLAQTEKRQEKDTMSSEVSDYAQNACKNVSFYENEKLNQQCSSLFERELPETVNGLTAPKTLNEKEQQQIQKQNEQAKNNVALSITTIAGVFTVLFVGYSVAQIKLKTYYK